MADDEEEPGHEESGLSNESSGPATPEAKVATLLQAFAAAVRCVTRTAGALGRGAECGAMQHAGGSMQHGGASIGAQYTLHSSRQVGCIMHP